eukprot:12172661-Heterocapsa_arctica.AAC.1
MGGPGTAKATDHYTTSNAQISRLTPGGGELFQALSASRRASLVLGHGQGPLKANMQCSSQ